MNRRSFIADMLKVGVACTFLPGAGRIWKPVLTPAQMVVFPVVTNPALNLNDLFKQLYDLKRARERMGCDPAYIYLSRKNDPLSFTTKGVFCQMREA